MIAPSTLAGNIVTALRAIPALVTAMGGTATRISAYADTFPQSVQLFQAIQDLPPPGMLVVWNGTGPYGRGLSEVWVHEFAVIVRPKPETGTATGISDIWSNFVNGIPTAMGGQKMLFTEVNSALHRMETPSIRRMSLQVSETKVLDYFEITMRFVEKGA
jgi:hypothetical protein